VVYIETQSTQQLVPRHIFVDFRENYGNFLSCFPAAEQSSQWPSQTPEQPSLSSLVEGQLWLEGRVENLHHQPIKMSAFQRELLEIDFLQFDVQQFELEQN